MKTSYLYLLYQTTRASYLAEEKNSLLGVLWHLLHPLAMTAVLYVVFSNVSVFERIENYPLFILAGLIPYNFFSHATTRAGTALLRGRNLVLNTTVPPELLVIQSVCIEAITFVVEVILLALLVALFGGVGLRWSAVSYLPVALALMLLVMGASLLVAGLVVFLTDLTYVWRVAMRMLFFLTPIFYSVDMLEHPLAARLIGLNPVAQIAELGRRALLAGEWIPLPTLGSVILGPSLLFLLGWLCFARLRRAIPEYI